MQADADTRRLAVAFSTLLILAPLAGCGAALDATGLGSGPTVSDLRLGEYEDQPLLMFNYTVDDYSDALLEGPSGQVIQKTTLEPDQEVAAFSLVDPRPGNYTIILQQGGETKSTKTASYEGASPTITTTEAAWSGNTLQRVNVTVNNNGDFPVKISEAVVNARDSEMQSSPYVWVMPGETESFSITPSYGKVSIHSAGEVHGSVTVTTSADELSSSFTKTFEGPDLAITNVEPVWEGGSLESTRVTVENQGDLTASAWAGIQRGDEVLASTYNESISPGQSVQYEITHYSGTIYEPETSGEIQLQAIANSPSGFTTQEFTREISSASLSIDSFTPVWENGRLTSATFTLSNNGDVATDFSASLIVNGHEVKESQTIQSLAGGETEEYEIVDDSWGAGSALFISNGGEETVKLELTSAGNSVTASSSQEFDGPSAQINSVDTTVFGNDNSDTPELSDLTLDVQNTGDSVLVYDSVRYEIDGVSSTESLSFESQIKPGASTTEYLHPDLTVTSGDRQLTIKFIRDGEVVDTETVTVTIPE
ncbi:hypothetical protein [Halogeometricum borinquense]|uniref:CARDB domain-containing protein n=2 Tax=Halogeometricum borinquense (strain ATCC 700274 / DSM 11551 / JCM 10706 / KCTC 4070 / PR3) TaxID=469382 RepID=E4NVD5_HALBP|nr:hypothetical protein [Halogeometricum borinquense]ADQ68819.1 hypothetical protein Hbor_32890 [Halogeometricum borinquense DSM 11551]